MKRIEHNEEKWIFPFLEYVPENGGENLPLVVQLHGAGERGYGKKDLDLLDVHGFSHILKEGEFPCRVVMPQCPKDTFWVARIESIHTFIDQIMEEFSVDADRVSLTGMSMGGFGTWFTAMAKPKRFAAIAPICGGCMPWNSGIIKKLPIWAFHGEDDHVVDVHYSRDMVEKLQSIGGNVKFTCYEGVRHNSWLYACNRELLEWLIGHKR